MVNHFVSFAAAFLIEHPIAVGLLRERYLNEKKSLPAPISGADISDVAANVLREEPQSLQDKESAEKWAYDLRGLGLHESTMRSKWLYLPVPLCEFLGPKLKVDWHIFSLKPECLIAFPDCLWNSFWASAKVKFQLTPERLEVLQCCGTMVFKRKKNIKSGATYFSGYWIFPKNVMKELNVAGEDQRRSVSKNPFKCQISPSHFWLQVSLLVAS
jgi:hypothetical protein